MKYDLFFVSRYNSNDNNWKKFKERFPLAQRLDNVSSLDQIKRKSFTKFFWVVWNDLEIEESFSFEYEIPVWDQQYVHVFKNGKYFDGVCIFSKEHSVSDKEFQHRFFTNKKEIEIIASITRKFEKFVINSYDEYLSACDKSTTEMFWAVWNDIDICEDFDFDYQVPKHNQHITHVFKNNDFFDGICLMSKNKTVTKKEFDYRFFSNKKEIDIVASTPKLYEKFNLSTYEDYLSAIDCSSTEMFWAVWNDIDICEDFDFDYQVPKHNQHITHIFKNGSHYDGICLFSKYSSITKKEFDHRFFTDKKEIDIVASTPKLYEKFNLSTYEDYLSAIEKSSTDVFWAIWNDIDVVKDFSFDYQIPKRDQHITHVFKNGSHYDGICLFSKYSSITKKEFDYRFFSNKKEIDIVASTPKSYDRFNVSTYEDYLSAIEKSSTDVFWAVWNDIDICEDFDFDYQVPKHNQHITHVFKNGLYYDGICLFSKYSSITKKEFDHRFFSNKNEIDILASVSKPYDRFEISNYKDYLSAIEKSSTDVFWAIWNDIDILDDFDFNYQIPKCDQHIVHIFKNKDFFDGLCLMSKIKLVTKKEFDHRFFIEKKEIDIVASHPRPFEKFTIDTYEDYIDACDKSSMEMFWMIPKEVEILDFDFDLYFNHHNSYDRKMNHVFQHMFRNEITYNGIACVPNNKRLSKKEIDFRFPIEKKQYEILASKLRPYDIIFISYNEPNADENYEKLKSRFSRAKRVHGVKGIHNAHKAAAELSDTNMFYVVDGDAEIVEDFNFDFEVSRHERDIVFVWQSLNPINDLVYGYGGVKLLPRDLVLFMDTNTVDMTLSISDRIRVINTVSNKTRFDTDEFNTWKSAFRECVKLSSKPIDETYDEETDFRLQAWCSKGQDKLFGTVCIDGAKAGREYGYDNIGNNEFLKKINDFEWLKTIYEQRTKDNHS